MRRTVMVLAVLVALAGVLFILQGTGVVPVGGMANQIIWAYIGGAMVLVAGGLLFYAWRSRSA